MVLPASPAHAAPPAAPWLDRLSHIFELGRGRGVLVLVRGGPERLGDVVRRVVGLSPEAEVLVRADALASLPPTSTAVLCLRREDFDWLNIARPVVLGHRIVLFGDAETALALERHAVDFCDWISHRIDAPAGPPSFAVHALRNAACARTAAAVWKGGDIDVAFAEALPGRSLLRVSAAMAYADLVSALRPAPRTWVVVTDLEEAFRVRRARWAAAEAVRYGRTILVSPGVETADLPTAHAVIIPMEEASDRLQEAGIDRGARIAALLDLDPEAIERAVAMARCGASTGEIERRAGELAQAPMPPRGASPRRLPDWPERVEMALLQWDEEVALHWATSWRAAEPENARSAARLAYVCARGEHLKRARALLDEAIMQAGSRMDPETAFEIHRAEGALYTKEDRPDRALRATVQAIQLLDSLHRSTAQADEIHFLHVLSLLGLGRQADAERAMRSWPGPAPGGEGASPKSMAFALVKLSGGEPAVAIPILRRAFEDRRDDSLEVDAIACTLAQALLARGDFAEAERVTRTAGTSAEERGRRKDRLRREHARALLGLGRFAEAEQELWQVLAGAPENAKTAVTRQALARSLIAQGRLEEAESELEKGIAEQRRAPAHNSALLLALLHEKAQIHHVSGRWSEAIRLLREVLREEERVWGKDHPGLSETLTALGDSFIRAGEPAAAQPHLRRACRIAGRAGDKIALAEASSRLAIAEATQRFPQAVHTARRALEAWSQSGQEPTSSVRVDLEAIAAGALPEKAQR
jgi:tetratricopeptide (TPR) repeat protein